MNAGNVHGGANASKKGRKAAKSPNSKKAQAIKNFLQTTGRGLLLGDEVIGPTLADPEFTGWDDILKSPPHNEVKCIWALLMRICCSCMAEMLAD